MSEIRRTALLSLLLLLTVAVPVLAQSSWAVAERDDAQILKLVTNLQGYTETLPGGADAPALVLYRQYTADSQEKVSKACVNMIVEVRDPTAVPAELLAPSVWWSEGTVTGRASFVLRKGEIERMGTGEMPVAPASIGVHQVNFAWGDLREGDVIGWSITTEQEGPFREIVVPMAERVPMVISNVTTHGNAKFVYRTHWYGMAPSELDIKEQEPKDGRPMVLKVSANQRAAVADRSLAPPFLASESHVVLALEEVYLDSQQEMVRSGWINMAGWNQTAAQIAVGLDDLVTKAKGMEIALSAVTTGKRTAHEKADAIDAYVREKFTLLEGPKYNPGGQRDVAEVFKAKEGTRTELVLLAAVLMRKSDVPATIAAFRDPAHGELDKAWEHFSQFTEAAIRVEADGAVVYYAPQCKECSAGTLPAAWVGAPALVWASDLATVVKADNETRMKAAMAAGTIDPATMQAELAKLDWSRFEAIVSR